MKIVLTGTEALSAPLAAALVEAGFEVETCPLVAIEQIGGPPVRPADYDWLLLTSRNGVEALFARLEGRLPRVAVVGRGTAEALREHGVEPDVVARTSTQEGLAVELPGRPGRVLFAGAEDAREVLVRELGADFVPLYRTDCSGPRSSRRPISSSSPPRRPRGASRRSKVTYRASRSAR